MKIHATHKMSSMISKSLEQPAEAQPYFDTSEIQDALSDMIFRALDGEDVLKECEGHEFLTDFMVDVVEHAKGDESPEVRACVSKKIPMLMDEGYEQKAAIAIAFSMCKKDPHAYEKAKDVPKQDRKLSDEDLRQMGRDRLASIDGTKIPPISNTREVNLSTTEDNGLAATFLPSYTRAIASPGRAAKEIEDADRISKDGTSEGARLGWQTRRRGAPPSQQGFTRESAFSRVDNAMGKLHSAKKELDEAMAKYQQIMSDPEDEKRSGWEARRYIDGKSDAVVAAADSAVTHAQIALKGVKGQPGIDEAKREEMYRKMYDRSWGVDANEVEDVIHEMHEVSRFLEPDPTDKAMEGESPFGSTSPVDKAGTSESVKRAWETRLGKKPPVEEEKPKGEREGVLAGAVREALREHLTQRQPKPPEPKPASKKDPNDLDIDISDIKPPDLSEWESDLKAQREKLRAKEEAESPETKAREKRERKEWEAKMEAANQRGDSEAMAELRRKKPASMKGGKFMGRFGKEMEAALDTVIERHGISKHNPKE